jgi:hypothetical protein
MQRYSRRHSTAWASSRLSAGSKADAAVRGVVDRVEALEELLAEDGVDTGRAAGRDPRVGAREALGGRPDRDEVSG